MARHLGRNLLVGCVLLVLAGCSSVVGGQPRAGADKPLSTRAAIATVPPAKPQTVTISHPGLVSIGATYDVESLTVQSFNAKGEIMLVAKFPPGQGVFTCFNDANCAFGAHGNLVQFVAHVGADITINNLHISVVGVKGPDAKHTGTVLTLRTAPRSP
jgi:hypothetical protein